MSTTFRSDRAAEAIRAAIARALREDVSDPRLGFVTLTACEVTHDLSFAKIFYTVLGDDEARQQAQDGFNSAKPFLRSVIGQEVPLRVVPEIDFRYDNSTDNALRLEEILSTLPELKKEPEADGKPDKNS
jgi:ribosome-binding factor A